MILHDLFDWSNAGVGGIGLLLTIAAIVQATGAKGAALRAEKSVRRHNAEVDFASLARMAKELHGYVEGGKMSEARLRTTDLRSDLALAIRVHEAFLGSQFRQLKERQVDLALVAEGLNRAAGVISQSERVRLLGITGAILDLLAGQCGKLRSSVEKGASNG
ncbi:MAG TPA: hypothetical protein VN776_02945 [Terracidiphilus sp.]|nr:hypothetical protein [Terracidiphilus sp.]